MPFIVKTLVGLAGLGCGACAIGMPSFLNKQSSTTEKPDSKTPYAQRTETQNTSQDGQISTSTDQDDSDSDGIPGNELKDKIRQEYDKYNPQQTVSLNPFNDFFDNNIKQTLNLQEKDKNNGELESQKGTNCKSSELNSETFCGYIEFSNKEGNKYKVKVSYKNNLDSANEGKIGVVKKHDSTVSYFDSSKSKGINAANFDFEKLTTFGNSNATEGEKVLQGSYVVK